MAISRASFVQETTTTTGTGTYSLAGATAGRQTLVAGNGSGTTVRYSITNGTDWEVGEGVVTSGTPDTLTRGTILESSNSGSAVSWGAGNKTISQVWTPSEADDTLYLSVTGNKSVSGNPYLAEQTVTDGATISWDISSGAEANATLAGNRTLDATAVPPAGTWCSFRAIQDGTGNRTLAYSADFDFGDSGSPTLSTAAGAEDVLSFRSNGTVLQFMGIAKGFA